MRSLFIAVSYCIFVLPGCTLNYQNIDQSWVSAWSASPTEVASPDSGLLNRTIEQFVVVTATGENVRLRLANEDEISAFEVSSVSVQGESVVFSGANSAIIPPNSILCSDPIALPVTAGDKISVKFYLPYQDIQPTIHWYGRERAFISKQGDFTQASSYETAFESDYRILLSGVDVAVSSPTIGVVAIGDSITDGSSAPVGKDTRWPDVAWRKLSERYPETALSNAGIGGDRLLRDARHTGTSPGVIKRLERDALGLSGSQVLVLASGINDISWPGAKMRGRELAPIEQLLSVEEMIAGYKSVAEKARETGRLIIVATITPYRGQNEAFENFFNENKERLRLALNAWIRASEDFDAVIDFDELVRDPDELGRLKSEFDSGDGIHPSELGFQVMGELAAEVIAEVIARKGVQAAQHSDDNCASTTN